MCTCMSMVYRLCVGVVVVVILIDAIAFELTGALSICICAALCLVFGRTSFIFSK